MPETDWVPFSPTLSSYKERTAFLETANLLVEASPDEPGAAASIVDEVRARLTGRGSIIAVPATARAASLVLSDLVAHGWRCRLRHDVVHVARPIESSDLVKERERVQRQLHVERDRQLQSGAVTEFIKAMERRRQHHGRWVSIFSLMRDGCDLAVGLRPFRDRIGDESTLNDLSKVISPYLQVIIGEEVCEKTGFRLVDIWRYFRHTWSNPYRSVPGRSFMVLVRDAAVEAHPVIGIGALASSAVQIGVRDAWIRWNPEHFVEELRANATKRQVRWLLELVDSGIEDIYLDDLLDGRNTQLTRRRMASPTPALIESLFRYAREERQKHQQLVDSKEHKRASVAASNGDQDSWRNQAESPLFRGKRAEILAMFLRTRALLRSGRKPVAPSELREKLKSPDARQTLQSLIRRAKSERVGVAMADISVCGAIAPYTAVLGGKLVSMLMTSPEIVVAYQKRYARAESVIASSIAGRAVIRPARLVFLGTTSLYGVEPTQYTRVHIPCEEAGGNNGESIRYALLGRTEGYGTSQFSSETVDAMSLMLAQRAGGQRVHSIFGEGVNPRLRKIRDGLDCLGLNADYFLEHGSPRLVYGVALARNFREYLLGVDNRPDYYLSLKNPEQGTSGITKWWAKRWLLRRIERDEVLEELKKHQLTHPIRHGARVPTEFESLEAPSLFQDIID